MTRLACLISERENKVYYTDTSYSVFTTGLLRKGIGRMIYPHDFRWFTPHLALLEDEDGERKVPPPSHTESFYKAIKQSASIHPQYQLIISIDNLW